MKKLLAGAAIALASLAAAFAPAGAAHADAPRCPSGTTFNPVTRMCECPWGTYWSPGLQTTGLIQQSRSLIAAADR
ncbi:MAG: hypothetical protein QOH91_2304 [Mycobacterium sp.]|nr:hypothetical protein [Mycobacterium sp.]